MNAKLKVNYKNKCTIAKNQLTTKSYVSKLYLYSKINEKLPKSI